jgi:hypothetical protein
LFSASGPNKFGAFAANKKTYSYAAGLMILFAEREGFLTESCGEPPEPRGSTVFPQDPVDKTAGSNAYEKSK